MATYIHELETWPGFRWNKEQLAKKLDAVRLHQGRLVGRMEALGFNLRADAVLETLTVEVIKSSEIEGEILDKNQVRSSIARRLGIDIGALTPADRHVDGTVEMMLDATQKFADPLTAERLFGWHSALFPTGRSGMAKIAVGSWRDDRNGPMQVVSGPVGREQVHYQAPAAGRLDLEINAFLDWFNNNEESTLVLKAAVAHLWFVTIHPFDDGNGRIARAIADLTLARSEQSAQRFYSMSAQIREERKAYYDILEATQKGDLDITPWLEWFLDCLDRAFDGAEMILATVMNKARFWEAHVNQSFNDRQRLVINRLLNGFEGKLTSSKWAKLAKCSHDTALRDIEDLVKRKILMKDPAGGRSTSYSLAGTISAGEIENFVAIVATSIGGLPAEDFKKILYRFDKENHGKPLSIDFVRFWLKNSGWVKKSDLDALFAKKTSFIADGHSYRLEYFETNDTSEIRIFRDNLAVNPNEPNILTLNHPYYNTWVGRFGIWKDAFDKLRIAIENGTLHLSPADEQTHKGFVYKIKNRSKGEI